MSASAPPPTKQRLAVFLDGTWNTEDDSTNVLHAYNLTREGIAEDGLLQKRYYDRGVGTGIFESVTGGGFGLGLQVNVREAYNWLVGNYNPGDEIYIFGFSRGAYTARSLVSFIASCGLIKRGAPLTVNQLWQAYGFISKNRDKNRRKWWEEVLARHPYYFRRINSLIKNDKPIKSPINQSEKLVAHWSQRIEITYLGIYDTVGAIGVEALGIPGLTGRLSETHNQYPSSIICNCRHALAIDEYRGSFRLTPFLDYVANGKSKDNKGYDDNIMQKWFIGAHSNVGGGYENNALSLLPFKWVMEGANNAGLKWQELEIPEKKEDKKHFPEVIRDSYVEFTGAIWPHILREKRYYRPIGRPDEVRDNYSLRTINEQIDSSVIEHGTKKPKYAPPHLLTHSLRSGDPALKIFADRQPERHWPDHNSWWSLPVLILWSLVATAGIQALSFLFWEDGSGLGTIGMALLAAAFVLADWLESRCNFIRALRPAAVVNRTLWNIAFWGRLLGAMAFLVGIVLLIVKLFFLVKAWDLQLLLQTLYGMVANWAPAAISAALIATLAKGIEKAFPVRATAPAALTETFKVEDKEQPANNWSLMFLSLIIAFIAFIPSILSCLDHSLAELKEAQSESYAGLILLMIFLVMIFIKSTDWAGKPTRMVFGDPMTIFSLQSKFTRSQLSDLFNSWTQKLSRQWVPDDKRIPQAWARLKEILRESLWRDLLGFIPIYSLVLGSFLYIGTEYVEQCYLAGFDCSIKPLAGIPLWLLLILITALADMLENGIHLLHIRKHPGGGSSNGLVLLGALFTLIKLIGFISAALMAISIFFMLWWQVMGAAPGGWRWWITVILTPLFLISLIKSGINSLNIYLTVRKRKQKKQA